jgi:O-antigen/teichoic acid export membrane protein
MKTSSSNPNRGNTPSRQAARGTLQLVFGRISFLAFGYLVTILLARGLGPGEYGVYGIIISVLVWIEQIGRFGVPEAVTKLIPEDDERAPLVEHTAQTFLLLVFLLLFVLSWFAAPALARLFQLPHETSLFRLAIIDIPFSGLYFAYQGILTGQRKFGAISTGLAVYGFTKLVAILIALLLGLSVFSALIVNILGTVGAFLCLAIYVPFKAFCLSFVHLKLILQLAFPAGLFLLASQVLSNLDLWSLKIIGSANEEIIGNYVAALNIARVPAWAFAAVNGVILPSISMALAQKNMAMTQRYVFGAGRFLFVTLLPLCVVLAFTAKDLMILLYTSRYAIGASFLVLQVFAFALFGVTQVFCEMLIARGNPYLSAGAALFHVPVALMLNVILIPHFGAMGASTALLLTALFVATVTGILVLQRFGPLIEFSTFVRVVLATAVMALVATQIMLAGPWLLLKYVCLLGVYSVALAFLGELTWDDLQPFVLWRREQTL